MPLSRFEKMLPWSGVLAGLAWIGQDALANTSTCEEPGGASLAG